MRLVVKALIILFLFGINIKAYPSPLGDFLWVPCFSSNNVYKVNIVTHEVAAIIPVGGGPAGVAVGLNMVYVTCRYSSRLYCISKFYDAVIDSFDLSPQLAFGVGVALDARNRIFVVGRVNSEMYAMDSSRVVKLSADGSILGSLDLMKIQGDGGWATWINMSVIGIAINEPEIMIPWQRSWDVNTGVILTDTSLSDFVNSMFPPRVYGYRGPGAAYSDDDRGWSSGGRLGQNFLIDHWQRYSWGYHDLDHDYYEAGIYGDVAVDDNGYVWTGNSTGYLIRYNPTLDQTAAFDIGWNQIKGIAIDRYGYIWVALYPQNVLEKFDCEGNLVGNPVSVGDMPLGFGDMTGHEYGHRMTAVDDQTLLPKSASILTAYPNPFNASTLISYSLAEPGPINIAVYNLLGREMITLYEGDQDAGEHKVTWNAYNFSSGIYFARLKTADYSGSLRIMLVK